MFRATLNEPGLGIKRDQMRPGHHLCAVSRTTPKEQDAGWYSYGKALHVAVRPRLRSGCLGAIESLNYIAQQLQHCMANILRRHGRVDMGQAIYVSAIHGPQRRDSRPVGFATVKRWRGRWLLKSPQTLCGHSTVANFMAAAQIGAGLTTNRSQNHGQIFRQYGRSFKTSAEQ